MKGNLQTVKVWDPYVRFFHWTLVFCIIGQFITAEDFQNVHVILGYVIIGLLLSRILWGFVGTKHARFNDFLYRPGTTIRYLKSLFNGRPEHYIGHNPAGGLMTIVLLLSLLVTTFTGLMTLGSEGKGPFADTGTSVTQLAHADSDKHGDEDRPHSHAGGVWKEIHEAMTGFIIFLVVVHVAGVIVSSWVHKENLILGMITGRKNAL
jgi:cytochrome b